MLVNMNQISRLMKKGKILPFRSLRSNGPFCVVVSQPSHFCTSSPPKLDPNNQVSSPPKTWVESPIIPEKVRPYLYLARMDKPVGTLLLFWPCCWGTALAAPLGTLPDFMLMTKFAIGAFIMRGAGCTINDLWDQDFDKKVERTKSRPLASGALTTKDALAFLALQLSGGLAILSTFNYTSILAGFASMPFVISYPLMKRITYWPQFVLGLTFNWGVWVGWTAIYDSVNFTQLLPLYGAGVCWTLVYDTLYGYQDRKDDVKIGKIINIIINLRPILIFFLFKVSNLFLYISVINHKSH